MRADLLDLAMSWLCAGLLLLLCGFIMVLYGEGNIRQWPATPRSQHNNRISAELMIPDQTQLHPDKPKQKTLQPKLPRPYLFPLPCIRLCPASPLP